jgi:hypothetical protein
MSRLCESIDAITKIMLKDVVEVQPLDNYRVRLRIEDGVEGVIDVSQLVSLTGVFAALRDRGEFVAVRVDPELGTICWPGGADLDPDVLYSHLTGKPLPAFERTATSE